MRWQKSLFIVFAAFVVGLVAYVFVYWTSYRSGRNTPGVLERSAQPPLMAPNYGEAARLRTPPPNQEMHAGNTLANPNIAYDALLGRHLVVPVAGVKAGDIKDTFNDERDGGRKHLGTDILAPRGTAVLAFGDGTIAKLFVSKPGGNTIYEFDPQGEFEYYYAHLDHYAAGLHEGQQVKAGETIGYVGTTGNAPPDTPHLHFSIMKLGPEKQWWKGESLDPYPLLKKLLR